MWLCFVFFDSDMSSKVTAEKIVELFERDARARKRLAELLVFEPDVRLVIVNAVLGEVATKSDLEKLRSEFRTEIKDIGDRLTVLSERVSGLKSRVDLLIKVFLGFNVPLLVAVIGILLKLTFG